MVAALVGMLIGRAIRLRDRQCSDGGAAARYAEEPRRPEIPMQNSGGHRADPDGGPGR